MTTIRATGRSMALLSVGLSVIWSAPTAAGKDTYGVGEAVPHFTLKVLNKDDAGESYVAIDKYFGERAKTPKKALVLSFFATYCGPCKKEIPYLSALFDTYRDKGLQIVLVTIDKDGPKIEEAKNLAKQADVKFPLLTDRFNIVARRYLIEKLPCVYILNSDGKVAMVSVGYDDAAGRELLDAVRKQLGEPTSAPVPDALKEWVHDAAPPEGGEDHGGASAAEAKTPATAAGGTDANPAGTDHGGATASADKSAGQAAAAAGTSTAAADEAKGRKKKRRKKKRKRNR